jgi:hypothetical protein
MNYEIYDNFLDPATFSHLQNTMFSQDFPWFYNDYIAYPHSIPKTEDGKDMNFYNLQFTHIFYQNHKPNSDQFDLIKPILDKINPYAIMRIKANMGPGTPERIISGMHVDYPIDDPNLKTAVFYLNDNNGSTMFENGEEVYSYANRLVVFDNNLIHSGVSCTDTKFRSLINFCYFK